MNGVDIVIRALLLALVTIHGYGLSLSLPAAWHGRVLHGVVVASAPGARLELREWQPSPLEPYTGDFERCKLHHAFRANTKTSSCAVASSSFRPCAAPRARGGQPCAGDAQGAAGELLPPAHAARFPRPPRLADGHERIEPTEGAGRPDRNPGLDGPVSRPDSLTTADPNAGPPAARWDRYPRRPLARLADPEIPLVGHVADRSAPDLDQLRGRAATKRSLQSLPCQAPLRHRPLGPLRDSTPDPAHDRSRAGGTRCCAAVRLAARLASREMQPG